MSECEITDWLSWIECHSGTAAWVQTGIAFVALLAIAVPYWMAKTADLIARRRFLASVAAIGGRAQKCFANAAMHCGGGGSDAITHIRSVTEFNRFRAISAAMNAIPVHQLPSYYLTNCVLDLQCIMNEGVLQWETAFNEISDHDDLVQAAAYAAAFSDLASRAHPFLSAIEAAAGNNAPSNHEAKEKKMRLNGWKRIGVVISVIWLLGAFMHTYNTETKEYWDREGPLRTACINANESRKAQGWETFDCNKSYSDAWAAFKKQTIILAAAVAVVPIPFGWLFVYLIIGITRWIKVGFIQR
jgi:hypothetical protein